MIMMSWLLFVTFLLAAEAQEHVGLKMSQSGLNQVLYSLVKNHSGDLNNITIPSNLHEITIKQKDLLSNPLILSLNEISNLNLNKDLKLFFKSSDIKIKGELNTRDVKFNIANVSSEGFDFKISLRFNQINLKAKSLSLCENRESLKNKNCGVGLKLNVSEALVQTMTHPLDLSISMKVKIKDGLAVARITKIESNLDSKKGPKLDIDFKSLNVPRISIVINGQETELDTSSLRQKVIEKKQFLAKKMLSFASDFIAGDLLRILNKYLKDKSLSTTISIFNKETRSQESEFQRISHTFPVDNTYVRPPIYLRTAQHNLIPAQDVFKSLVDQFSDVIRQAKIDLLIHKLASLKDQSIDVRGFIDFVLNHTRFKVGETLGNSERNLPPLDLNFSLDEHVSLAISEPVINGALDLANSTGLFQEIAEEVIKEKSFSLRNLKLHFVSEQSFKLVANVQVDLKKLRTSFWRNPLDWAGTEIGIWLERNNNNSVIYFPLEFEVLPVVYYSPTNEAKLSLKILSAFNGDSILNTFNYPSNVGQMYQVVRKAVVKKLREQMDSFENKVFDLDITKFLGQSGFKFKPKTIQFQNRAYIIIGAEIVDIVIKKD
jgi:hypothetical protein